ncbi:MAG: MBL fold metallo-hydrolase [Vicingaceae bacterium]
MKIYPIPTRNFKLDGGAMFGVVPKSLWQRTNPADSNNMCSWALRCMLIEKGDRLMLIDNGMGEKQSEKFFSYYYLHGDDSLENSLRINGFHPDDITDVFLTHLHFDHCGGGIKWNKDRTGYEATFKNATYWSNRRHWKWATEPNDREKASFLKENILPMEEFGQLKFVDDEQENFDWFEIFYADGHTDAQMIPIIDYQEKKLVFMADLLPSAGHIPLPYVMGYDTRPLKTLEDRKKFYKRAVEEEMYLFLEHDAQNEVITLKDTEKGARLDQVHTFQDVFES